MATFMFNPWKGPRAVWATADIRVALYENLLVEATEQDAATISALSANFVEPSDTSYGRQTTTSSLTINNTSNKAEIKLTVPINFGNLAGGETVVGALTYEHITNDTDSVPASAHDLAASKVLQGDSFDLTFDSGSGIVWEGS